MFETRRKQRTHDLLGWRRSVMKIAVLLTLSSPEDAIVVVAHRIRDDATAFVRCGQGSVATRRPNQWRSHTPTTTSRRQTVSSFLLFAAEKGDNDTVPPMSSQSKNRLPTNNKTKKFTINPNLSASISSDGVLKDHRKEQAPQSSRLGVPSKRKAVSGNGTTGSKTGSLSKQERQRTGSGSVDSTQVYRISVPENEDIQVLEAKRGSKTVTIIRGMTSPMDDRKKLLKQMKSSFGVGGTLVNGVLELQGPFSDQALGVLQKKGYKKATKVGTTRKK